MPLSKGYFGYWKNVGADTQMGVRGAPPLTETHIGFGGTCTVAREA